MRKGRKTLGFCQLCNNQTLLIPVVRLSERYGGKMGKEGSRKHQRFHVIADIVKHVKYECKTCFYSPPILTAFTSLTYLIRVGFYDRLSHLKQNKSQSNQKCFNTCKSLNRLMAKKHEPPRWRWDSRNTPAPQPTHPPTPGHPPLLSLPSVFSPSTWTHQEQWRGTTEASGKENTLKASMGVKGAEQRMTWVMEMRADRRSNTGGSLLRTLLNRNDSPTHWLQYPLSHERTQLDPHTHIHTRLANSHAPWHVHTMHVMQMRFLPYKHTTAFLHLQLEEEDRVRRSHTHVWICRTFR